MKTVNKSLKASNRIKSCTFLSAFLAQIVILLRKQVLKSCDVGRDLSLFPDFVAPFIHNSISRAPVIDIPQISIKGGPDYCDNWTKSPSIYSRVLRYPFWPCSFILLLGEGGAIGQRERGGGVRALSGITAGFTGLSKKIYPYPQIH